MYCPEESISLIQRNFADPHATLYGTIGILHLLRQPKLSATELSPAADTAGLTHAQLRLLPEEQDAQVAIPPLGPLKYTAADGKQQPQDTRTAQRQHTNVTPTWNPTAMRCRHKAPCVTHSAAPIQAHQHPVTKQSATPNQTLHFLVATRIKDRCVPNKTAQADQGPDVLFLVFLCQFL